MQNKWIVITLFVLIMFLTLFNVNSSWAADPQYSYNRFNNSSNLNSSINMDNHFNPSLNESNNSSNQCVESTIQKSVLISGNIIRCDSGAPFSGVTVKVSDLAGTEIARTQTDMNGNYNFNFNSYDSSFKVTASYPGHVTLSKIINLNFNGNVLVGTANFQPGQ